MKNKKFEDSMKNKKFEWKEYLSDEGASVLSSTAEIWKSFVTGSYAYGVPTRHSDIDLVVLVSEEDLARLRLMADRSDHSEVVNYISADGEPLRFGKLNLICVTRERWFHIWREGTEDLCKRKPVTRDEAVNFFKDLRRKNGYSV